MVATGGRVERAAASAAGIAAALLLAASCFSPDIPVGAACAPGPNRCPMGQACVDGVCGKQPRALTCETGTQLSAPSAGSLIEPALSANGLTLVALDDDSGAFYAATRETPNGAFGSWVEALKFQEGEDWTFFALGGAEHALYASRLSPRMLFASDLPDLTSSRGPVELRDKGELITSDLDGPDVVNVDGRLLIVANSLDDIYYGESFGDGDVLRWNVRKLQPDGQESRDDPALGPDGRLLMYPSKPEGRLYYRTRETLDEPWSLAAKVFPDDPADQYGHPDLFQRPDDGPLELYVAKAEAEGGVLRIQASTCELAR